MAKTNKHIIIVRSPNKRLSSMSKESGDAIFQALSKYFTKVDMVSVSGINDLKSVILLKPDLVFLGAKYIAIDPNRTIDDANKVWLSEYFDKFHIAYTGSMRPAHELEQDKPLAKLRVLESNLMTSPFYVLEPDQKFTKGNSKISFPLFIKPANRGGGLGIDSGSVVNSITQLEKKVNLIHKNLKSSVLIEKYLSGREFSVAILRKDGADDYFLMPIELIAPADKKGIRILGQRTKSLNAEEDLLVGEGIIKTKITALAIKVFKALGARDYGRIDIRLDEEGTPHFLEANLMPSLISGYGSFPKACLKNIGVDYENMILRIVSMGLSRS
ncbi:hypothetical protein KC960_03325 [Candidatus Saccharibacteria bacterium]|nr:hypothetical protein [Candidatus Saccharibacteria bacterium]